MKTRIGTPTTITSGVTGFFEAAWLFERNDTYYLAYAGEQRRPDQHLHPGELPRVHRVLDGAEPARARGPTAGRMLAPVSSTTSHPAIAEFKGEWYMAYHTADAVGGNHFRRSVAIDKVEWDDTQTPARILPGRRRRRSAA